jgi:DNA-binding MarR family transcriptional regulator
MLNSNNCHFRVSTREGGRYAEFRMVPRSDNLGEWPPEVRVGWRNKLSESTIENPLERRLGYLLRRAAISAMNALTAQLEQIGLRRVEVSMLALIWANPSITASQIGRILDISGANMVPLTRSLEEKELIERRRLDGKSHGLHLTAKGRDVHEQARVILDSFEAAIAASVSDQQRTQVEAALRTIWKASDELASRR